MSMAPNLLHERSRDGNVEEVKNLLETGADPNHKDSKGQTSLNYACMEGHVEVVRELIQGGADVNKTGPKEATSIAYSCRTYHAEVEKSCHKCSKRWWTPLHFACDGGHANVVKLLLGSGAEFTRDGFGCTGLHLACLRGHEELIGILVEGGCQVDDGDTVLGYSALHWACRLEGHIGVVRKLLELGAYVDAKDKRGNTPLCSAVRMCRSDLIDVLLDGGATLDVNCSDFENSNSYSGVISCDCISIHNACYRGLKQIARILLELGADVNGQDNFRFHYKSPLHLACETGSVELVELLLEYDPDLECKDRALLTPYSVAGYLRHVEITEVLVRGGAKVDEARHTRDLLYKACASEDIEMVKKLLDAGAKIDSDDLKHLRAPLHWASQRDNHELVQLVLWRAATVEAECSCRDVPTPIAMKCKWSYFRELLKEPTLVNSQDHAGNTLLHFTLDKRNYGDYSGPIPRIRLSQCFSKDLAVVKFLVKAGADVNLMNCKGEIPFYNYIRGYSHRIELYETTLFLLEAGMDVKALPWSPTIIFSSECTLSLLLDYGAAEVRCGCIHQCCDFIFMCKFYRPRIPPYVFQPYLKHAIKAEVAGLIHADSVQYDYLEGPYDPFKPYGKIIDRLSFKSECEEELQKMKSEFIGDSVVTFHDLLRCQDMSALRKQRPWSLMSEDCYTKFPIYGHMIYCRYLSIKKTLRIAPHCCSFFKLTDLPRLPPECALMILERLSYKDISNVVDVIDSYQLYKATFKKIIPSQANLDVPSQLSKLLLTEAPSTTCSGLGDDSD